MTTDPVTGERLGTPEEQYAYANQTYNLCVSNWPNVYGLRWLRWWRVNREVQRRMRVLEEVWVAQSEQNG